MNNDRLNIPRVLALIPARGGSRRLPGKNARPLCGKPLIHWSIQVALASSQIHETIVTSDDDQILDIASRSGVRAIRRPPELALDDSSTMDAVWHALDQLENQPDILILLQPTSPLRRAMDVEKSVEMLGRPDVPSVIGVSDRPKRPDWAYRMDADFRLRPFSDSPRPGERIVGINGAIYAGRTEWVRQTGDFMGEGMVGLCMPEDVSIDIDTLEDFNEAERLCATLSEREVKSEIAHR